MKYYNPSLSILLLFCVSLALADDLKTTNGKVYKNASVTRVEPDGVMIKFSGGLVKIPFAELPEELRQLYHYDPEAAKRYAAENAAQINAQNAIKDEQKKEDDADRLLQQFAIFAIIKPFHYGREETTVSIQEYQDFGHAYYEHQWEKVGKEFTGVLDQPMPQSYEEGDVTMVTLYKIGHSDDSNRHPLFTMNKEKAKLLLLNSSK